MSVLHCLIYYSLIPQRADENAFLRLRYSAFKERNDSDENSRVDIVMTTLPAMPMHVATAYEVDIISSPDKVTIRKYARSRGYRKQESSPATITQRNRYERLANVAHHA